MNRRMYVTDDVCSEKILFNIVDGRVRDVEFLGGCYGNLRGISLLVEGMKVGEAITRLRGIDCDGKGTSCPDQLARALDEVDD